MADPISLLASLIAVATAGIQVTKKLCKLADTIGNSNEEIKSISEQVSDSARVIEDLHDFLEDAKDLFSKKALNDAKALLDKCESVFADIRQMLKFTKRKHGNNIWQGIQWNFRRDKIVPLYAKLESYKSMLTLMLSTMRFGNCLKQMDMDHDDSQAVWDKEDRYRTNLEIDILKNSAAIKRWYRAESEARMISSGPSYYDPQQSFSAPPSAEVKRLSALVPYKPLRSDVPPNQYFLSRTSEASRNPKVQQQHQLHKAVDTLLATWTTLDQPVSSSGSGETKQRPPPRKPLKKSSQVQSSDTEGSSTSHESPSTKEAKFKWIHPYPPLMPPYPPLMPPNPPLMPPNPLILNSSPPYGSSSSAYPQMINNFQTQGAPISNIHPFPNPPPLNSAAPSEPYPIPHHSGLRAPFEPYYLPPTPSSRAPFESGGPGQISGPTNSATPFVPGKIPSPKFPSASSIHPAYTASRENPGAQEVEQKESLRPEEQKNEVKEPASLAKELKRVNKNISSEEILNEVPTKKSTTKTKKANKQQHLSKEEPRKWTNIYVKLTDPFGRTFKFPYRTCSAWSEMRNHVQDIFNDDPIAESYRDRVQTGGYDICDEDDAILLPKTWDLFFQDHSQTGLTVKMRLRPSPEESNGGIRRVPREFTSSPVGSTLSIESETRSRDHGRYAAPSVSEDEDRSDSSKEDSDDHAENLDSDDLDWRNHFLHKLDQHDDRLQKLWKAVMKQSKAKAESMMLEYLLSDSRGQVQEQEYSPNGNNQRSQPITAKSGQLTIDRSKRAKDRGSTFRAMLGLRRPTSNLKGSSSPFNKASSAISLSPPQEPEENFPTAASIMPSEIKRIASPDGSRSGSLVQQGDARQGLLQSGFQALEGANPQAEHPMNKAKFLEQKLQQVREVVARRDSQRLPATPPEEKSPSTRESFASSDVGHLTAGLDDVDPTDKASSGSPSKPSFRKRLFGRYRLFSAGTLS